MNTWLWCCLPLTVILRLLNKIENEAKPANFRWRNEALNLLKKSRKKVHPHCITCLWYAWKRLTVRVYLVSEFIHNPPTSTPMVYKKEDIFSLQPHARNGSARNIQVRFLEWKLWEPRVAMQILTRDQSISSRWQSPLVDKRLARHMRDPRIWGVSLVKRLLSATVHVHPSNMSILY